MFTWCINFVKKFNYLIIKKEELIDELWMETCFFFDGPMRELVT